MSPLNETLFIWNVENCSVVCRLWWRVTASELVPNLFQTIGIWECDEWPNSKRKMKGLSATLQFTVDQLCASLLLYKVHKLSLNAPFTKKQYWKALPSSIIQDLIVILIFQWATHLIISRLLQDRKHEGYESLPVSRPLDEKVNLQSEDSLESAYSENPHCLQYFPRKSTLKYLLGLALSGILLIIATSINLIVLCTLVAYTARGKWYLLVI